MTRLEILNALKAEIAKETGLAPSGIDEHAPFYTLGLDSISSVFILDELEKTLGIEMNPMFFWDYPTVSLLADHITTLRKHG